MKTFAPAVVVVCLFKCPLQVTAMKAEHTVVDPQLLRGLIPGFYSSTADFASSSGNTTPLLLFFFFNPPLPSTLGGPKKLLQFSFLKNQQPQNEDPDGWLGGPVCCGRGRGEMDSEPRWGGHCLHPLSGWGSGLHSDRIRSTAWSDGVGEGSEPEENFTQTASVAAAGVPSK